MSHWGVMDLIIASGRGVCQQGGNLNYHHVYAGRAARKAVRRKSFIGKRLSVIQTNTTTGRETYIMVWKCQAIGTTLTMTALISSLIFAGLLAGSCGRSRPDNHVDPGNGG